MFQVEDGNAMIVLDALNVEPQVSSRIQKNILLLKILITLFLKISHCALNAV
jgi:hypothetical protein